MSIKKVQPGGRVLAATINGIIDKLSEDSNDPITVVSSVSARRQGNGSSDLQLGFSPRSLAKKGDSNDGWQLWLNPGLVILARGNSYEVESLVPTIKGQAMDGAEYPPIKVVENCKIYLIAQFDEACETITKAIITSNLDYDTDEASKKSIIVILGEVKDYDIIPQYHSYHTGAVLIHLNVACGFGVTKVWESKEKACLLIQPGYVRIGNQQQLVLSANTVHPSAESVSLQVKVDDAGGITASVVSGIKSISDPVEIDSDGKIIKGGSYTLPLAEINGDMIKQFIQGSLCLPTRSQGGSTAKLPFSVVHVKPADKDCLDLQINGGCFRTTSGDLINNFAAMLYPCTHKKWVIGIKWSYNIQGDVTDSEVFYGSYDGYSHKEVLTPITSQDGIGQSQVILAWGTYEPPAELETTQAVVTINQLVTTSLRAYWLPGYVDSIPGAIGQYADASIGALS